MTLKQTLAISLVVLAGTSVVASLVDFINS